MHYTFSTEMSFFIDIANQEAWTEFHKLPRDVWLKELEAAAAKETKKQTPFPV